MITNLDHIAIVVENTEKALHIYRDQLGLPVLFSEVLEEQGVKLTHLDLGNCHLQIVEPLWPDHLLRTDIETGDTRLHHICLKVDSVTKVLEELVASGITVRDATPRRGPKQCKAAFLDPTAMGDVLFEITSD